MRREQLQASYKGACKIPLLERHLFQDIEFGKLLGPDHRLI